MLRKKRKSETIETVAELPMTPMIDIIFQLLIFFMCTLHFRDVEGKLTSTLPRHGPGQDPVSDINTNEIRIRLAYSPAAQKTSVTVGRLAAKESVGELLRSTRDTEKDIRMRNGPVFQTLRTRVLDLYARTLSSMRHTDPGRLPRVIIDATNNTPYEHVIGAMNACKEGDIETIEFSADPRFSDDILQRSPARR